MTKREVNIRAALYIAIAVLSFLMASDDYREYVGGAWVLATGATNAGLLAWRVFIDQSAAQKPDEKAGGDA